MSLSDNLRKLRNSLGLTQDQVSKDLKMNRATYAHYETGRREPDIETLKLLAKYFNVTTDNLLDNNISTPITDIPLGERLKELRENYKMTQEELADKIGLVRTAIANYETGRTNPDAETLSIIANIFNTNTDYLLGRTNIKEPINEFIGETKITSSPSDKLSEGIRNLSPESQEELKKLIELYKMKDMQDRNTEFSDEISKPE